MCKKTQMLNSLALRGSKYRSQHYNKNDNNGYAYIGAILFDKKYCVLWNRNELLQN
jgi:hypothetical protein